MPSRLFFQVRKNLTTRRLGKALDTAFETKRRILYGTYLGNNQIRVQGQDYEFRNESGVVVSAGDSIQVRNIQRKASAVYVPSLGSGIGVSGGGGASSTGTNIIADHLHNGLFNSGGNLAVYLRADGTIAGATGQAQDFGALGIKGDVIAESTAAAGVTADGVLLKDNGVTASGGLIGPSWKPAADSTTALQLQNVAGSPVVTVNTISGYLGIGKTPVYRLDVAGTTNITGTPASSYGLNVTHTISSGSTSFGAQITINQSGSGNFGGLNILANTTGSNNTGVALPLQLIFTHGSSGTIGTGYAGYFSRSTTGGIITNLYGSYIANVSGGGPVTNNYGLYIANQTGGATNYAIYSAGGVNYFGSNIGVGTTTPATPGHFVFTSATTNARRDILTLGANVTGAGVGAAGLGVGILLKAESSTTDNTLQAMIASEWIVATHASRTARLAFSAYDTAAREGLRIDADGAAARIGLFGVAAIARPTTAIAAAAFVANTSGIVNDTATWGGYTMGQVVQALQNLGALT